MTVYVSKHDEKILLKTVFEKKDLIIIADLEKEEVNIIQRTKTHHEFVDIPFEILETVVSQIKKELDDREIIQR